MFQRCLVLQDELGLSAAPEHTDPEPAGVFQRQLTGAAAKTRWVLQCAVGEGFERGSADRGAGKWLLEQPGHKCPMNVAQWVSGRRMILFPGAARLNLFKSPSETFGFAQCAVWLFLLLFLIHFSFHLLPFSVSHPLLCKFLLSSAWSH